MSERGVRLYAEDIREAIRRIEEYTVGVDFDDFTGGFSKPVHPSFTKEFTCL